MLLFFRGSRPSHASIFTTFCTQAQSYAKLRQLPQLPQFASWWRYSNPLKFKTLKIPNKSAVPAITLQPWPKCSHKSVETFIHSDLEEIIKSVTLFFSNTVKLLKRYCSLIYCSIHTKSSTLHLQTVPHRGVEVDFWFIKIWTHSASKRFTVNSTVYIYCKSSLNKAPMFIQIKDTILTSWSM